MHQFKETYFDCNSNSHVSVWLYGRKLLNVGVSLSDVFIYLLIIFCLICLLQPS